MSDEHKTRSPDGDEVLGSREEIEALCMRNLLANPAERVFFKDRKSRFLLVSAGYIAALAPTLSVEELVGKTDFDIFSAPHASAAYEDEQRVLLTGQPIVGKVERETYRERPDAWVSTTKLPLLDADGRVVGTWGTSRDITLQVQAEERLAHRALHDPLTELPNRALAIDRAEQLLARARREQAAIAALFIDLDGFKSVNDNYGHAVGDEVLRTVAERIRLTIRPSDTAARIGGDEFVVFLDSASSDVAPELVAERILEVLREPYRIEGGPHSVTASAGLATGFRANAERLLRDADVALYEAKAAGRNTYVTFQSEMHAVVHDRLTLEMDLADAVEQGQLFIVYQPTVELRSQMIAGVEALVRWRHPTRGELSPAVFIPLAEKGGTIVSIGRWVLQQACRQVAAWNDAGHRLGVAVNVAARQLDSDRFVADVREVLRCTGLPAELLTLEVTETTLMHDAVASARRLATLKQLGVKIAIDDFGTGYSSLAYLQQFAVDLLKIDRSFVDAAGRSSDSAALIHTLVQLARDLRLATVAEGIEHEDQLELVCREGCDYGQGYLFSRPLRADDLERLLGESAPALGLTEQAH